MPKRLGAVVGVAVPEAGAEVVLNRFPPAGLLAAPNNDPPDEAPAACPNGPVKGAVVEGVAVVPVLPKLLNMPPFGANKFPMPPVWGVLVPPGLENNEGGVDVAPVVVAPVFAPNRAPAGAVVEPDCPEPAPEAGVPNWKDISASVVSYCE